MDKDPERGLAESDPALSPGNWYPTVIRRELITSGMAAQAKRTEETWRFSVDFKSDIPDDLFKAESPRF
jgi:hypothetical protein